MKANERRRLKAAETFETKSSFIHLDKYDYSLVNYVNCKTKVIIICPAHGTFSQTPNNHLTGNGCPLCKDEQTKTRNSKRNKTDAAARTYNFIKTSSIIHNSKYDYSLVNYVNAFTPVKIICKIHGMFEQLPSNHIQNRGCILCGKENKVGNYTKETFENCPELKHKLGFLYLTKIVDNNQEIQDIFLKIGITTRLPKYRLSGLHSCGNFSFHILIERKMKMIEAFTLEQKIIKEFVNNRHFPKTRFGGHTECFKYSILDQIQTMF